MIKGLILAFQFLTRLPINIAVDFDNRNIRNAIFFFPFVGAVIGAIAGFIYYIISPLNLEIASFITMLTLIILTGGLHIDGLSDTFDGFLSNRNKEKILEIMKDSRVGAFGVLSIVILLLFKYILIKNTPNLPIGLILSLANSRFVASYIVSYKKSARPGGLGDLFNKSNPKKLIVLSGLIYLIILLTYNKFYIIPLITTIIAAEFISHISCKKIDGLTGDVYGTIIEIGECISLLTYSGMMIWI